MQLPKPVTNYLTLLDPVTSDTQVLDDRCVLVRESSADIIQGVAHFLPSTAAVAGCTISAFLQIKLIIGSNCERTLLDILLNGGSVHGSRSDFPCRTASCVADTSVGLQSLRRLLHAAHKIIVGRTASLSDRE